MIKPDDVKVLDESDEERVKVLDEHISEQLKAKKGVYVQPLWNASDGEKGRDGLFLPAGPISDAVWAEVIRRFLAAGWTLKIEPKREHAPRLLRILHPKAVLPGEYVLRAGVDGEPIAED